MGILQGRGVRGEGEVVTSRSVGLIIHGRRMKQGGKKEEKKGG